MQVIVRPRQGGKSTEALRLAVRHFAYIVVATRCEGDELAARARQLQLDIPYPITWDDLMSMPGRWGRRGRSNVKVVIDNLDRCVQQHSMAEVVGVTLTDGQTTYTRSDTPGASVSPGEVDGYGRKHFRVTVDGQAFTGWLEPAGES